MKAEMVHLLFVLFAYMSETNLYASFVSYSTQYQNAILRRSSNESSLPAVQCFRSNRDLDENKARLYLKSFSWSSSLNRYIDDSLLLIDCVKPILSSHSPSQRKTIVIRSLEKKTIIELIDFESGNSIRLDVSKYHGDVINDSWFSGQSWSSDERYFVYVAKQSDRSKTSAFSTDPNPISLSNSVVKAGKYDYVEDWGERFDGVSSLELVVVDTHKDTIYVVPNIDTNKHTVGQPIFRPSKESIYEIVYTAWENNPKKLGMVYCYQRKCSLYHANLTDWLMGKTLNGETDIVVNHIQVTSELLYARSPRFNSQGNNLAFIGRRRQMASHNGCFELFIVRNFDFQATYTSEIENLTELITRPEEKNSFPGLFADQLPLKCFIDDDQRIIFNSLWGSNDTILTIDINSKVIVRNFEQPNRSPDDWNDTSCSAHTVLDVMDHYVLFSKSNLVNFQNLFLIDLLTNRQYPVTSTNHHVSLPVSVKATAFAPVNEYLQFARFKIFQHSGENGMIFESIIVFSLNDLTDDSAGLPLIVIPHGGPHSCITVSFYTSYAYLISKLKAGIVFVNYRGSTGFGEDSIQSLLGNIGRHDVDDCLACVNHALKLERKDVINASSHPDKPLFDKNRLAVVGGSHGGFLTAHLIGQYPNMFKAATMRNPVTNLPSMVTFSDIPDWCWVEAGLEYDFNTFPVVNEEVLSRLLYVSPCRYVDQVKTPTLICLGGKDRRVPPGQGVEYYHLLKSRGVHCKLLIFPEDNHAIDQPTTEGEQWIAIAEWLDQYLL